MEKIQGENRLNKNRKLGLTTVVAGLVLSACGTTPMSGETHKNQNTIPSSTEVKKQLISKAHTHNGPLGDKICTYTYNTQEKVLMLCEAKTRTVNGTFIKNIPAKTEHIPAKTIQKPGTGVRMPDKIELRNEYHYGFNPSSRKYEYFFGPHNITTPGKYIPPEYINIPARTEYNPAYSVLCKEFTPYNQVTGVKNPPYIECEKISKK